MADKRIKIILWVGSASIFFLAVMIGWVSALASGTEAGVHYIAPGGDCGGMIPCYASLQAAVGAADAGDTLLVAGGYYLIPPGAQQLVLIDKSLTIHGGYTPTDWINPDPLANPVTLDALNSGRVMVVTGPVTLRMDGLRLVNGNAAGLGGHTDGSDAGGGLYILGANVHMDRLWVLNGTAPEGYGGGIYARGDQDTLEISRCTVQSSQARSGAGIYMVGVSASLTDNTIQLNTGEDSGLGAGICIANSQGTLRGNLVKGNSHGKGGGLAILNSSAQLSQNTVNENESWSNGGGIYIQSSTVTLNQNLVSENIAGNGGGLDGRGGSTITMTHNTVELNTLTHLSEGGYGGGANLLANGSGHIYLYANQIDDNTALSGGGLHLEGDQPIRVDFNQLRGNAASHQGAGVTVASSNIRLNGNLIQDNSGTYCVGAGIAIFADATFTNNIVTGNTCPQYNFDSGIYVEGASPSLYHTTIANNGATLHAGVYVVNGPGGQISRPGLYNSIITDQTYGVYVEPSSSGSLAIVDHVLWWNNTVNTIGDVTVIVPAIGDPRYVNATNDFHISAGSAAIGQGFDAGIPRDIDFQPRRIFPDLGADEYWAPGELKQVYMTWVLR